MKERLQQLIDTNEFEFLKTMSEEDIWKFAFAILYVFSESGGQGMTHINTIRPTTLEEQLDDLIKNADKEEDKERFKALKVLANYYSPSQISTSIDNFADGRYDLTIGFSGCYRGF